jgi:hypothetical protein
LLNNKVSTGSHETKGNPAGTAGRRSFCNNL